MRRFLLIMGGGFLGLALPAMAEAGYTAGAVNLRSGPGTYYGVITTAPPGAWVSVHSCTAGWCSVAFNGINGWMSAGLIVGGQPAYYPRQYAYVAPPPPPPPPVYYAYPQPYYPYYYRPYRYRPAYSFSFGFGRHW